MREVTEKVARDPSSWTRELAEFVQSMFDELAPGWDDMVGDGVLEVIEDALARGADLPAPVVELGAGTGAVTRVLASHASPVFAGDLSAEMLVRLDPALAARIRLDGSRLPFRDRSVGTLVCANMLLFPDEVDRVLREDGELVWVNSIGERTPIHLSADAVADSLGEGYQVTASQAGWGTWAVARRR